MPEFLHAVIVFAESAIVFEIFDAKVGGRNLKFDVFDDKNCKLVSSRS